MLRCPHHVIQDCLRSSSFLELPYFLKRFYTCIRDDDGKAFEEIRRPEIRKIMNISVIAAIGYPVISGIWLNLGQFIENLPTKCPNGDGIQFITNKFVKHFDKVFPDK